MTDPRNSLNFDESSTEDDSVYEDDEILESSYVCIKCSHSFKDVSEMFQHLRKEHQLDILEMMKIADIRDEYDWIKIINYLRTNTNSLSVTDIRTRLWKDEKYLVPVLPDDNLLFYDFSKIVGTYNYDEKNEYIKELESKVQIYEQSISRLQMKVVELMEQMDVQKVEENDKVDCCERKVGKLTEEDVAYFSGYSHYSIHDTMIKDKVRTESYRQFIENVGVDYFRDKIVLDVGCGTGILSMFAARAGARHVYGIDCADIIYDAMAIVEKNGFKDTITLIHGKVEDIDLPLEKVDVVISEWMGYFLIFESMLDSVIYACRRYLEPEKGMVFPGVFTLNIIGADMSSYRANNIDCWNDVYGINMETMKSNIRKEVFVDTVPVDDVMTNSVIIRRYDVQDLSTDDPICTQLIEQRFSLNVLKSGKIGAIVGYFDTFFMPPESGNNKQVMFSTCPSATPTHWQQTVFMLDHEISVISGKIVTGCISVRRHNREQRALKVALRIGESEEQHFQFI